jgi:hypothetical protein
MLFFLICLSVVITASDPVITIHQTFATQPIYDDTVTVNVVAFRYTNTSPTNNAYIDTNAAPESIKLGIVSSSNALIDLIWEYQPLANSSPVNIIQSVDIRDLNNDTHADIIINYIDVESDYPDQIISTFLLNKDNAFQELSETFVQSRYQIQPNGHLKYETPLALFGSPYMEEDPSSEPNYWVDHYAFQETTLVNINHTYRAYYETIQKDAKRKLTDTLLKVEEYSMSDEITINQLQLEEYFNEITELKTMIHRSRQILY